MMEEEGFPEDSLELSFPALRGASGAGVVGLNPESQKLFVLGIVKANANYELLPVQEYSVKDEIDGKVIDERTHYYLPAGVAVHVKHLRALVAKCQFPTIVDS